MKEHVAIQLCLNKQQSKKFRTEINSLTKNTPEVRDNDTLTIDYKFQIEYIGDIRKNLKAISILCSEPGLVKQANCEMIEEGRILCYEVLKELDNLIRKLK